MPFPDTTSHLQAPAGLTPDSHTGRALRATATAPCTKSSLLQAYLHFKCTSNPTVRICLSRKLSKIHRLTVEILHVSRTIHGLTMGPESSRCHCLSMHHFHPFKMGIAYIACADVPHQLTQRGMDIESIHSKLSSLQVS